VNSGAPGGYCFETIYQIQYQSTPTPQLVVHKKEIDLTQQVIVHSSWLSYSILLESTIKRIVKGVRIIHL
jgi:hypothetical protein